ncbi:MAG: TonB-dependent receptor [Allosphingosinicella sp.]|uniref:TonB-dependent receptor n=1 Tax=Allosphingosinicella sp. TaxID=2823234 RepID=UPI00396105D8
MIHFFESRRASLLGGAAVAALALGAAAPAYAETQVPAGQEGQPGAETEAEGSIVVTGFRAALASAARQKQTSDLIVESVSAEDIGKLPDNSIAESIARLPGLTAQRLDGRAQVISIRGFAPDFSTTLLNGREQVTTGDNRGVEFDQYPSEVLNQVLVYKTPNASLIGQGLSGTVDLRTIRPLAYGRQVLSVNARGEYVDLGKLNAGSKDRGYRVSATWVDQFANDTIGVSIGVARLDSPTQIERFNAWGYPDVAANGPAVIGGSKPYVVSNRLVRTGVVGTLEWQAAPAFTMVIDGYYSKFEDEQILRGIELPLFWSAAQLQPGFTAQDGLVTAGTFNGVKGVVRNDANRRDADIYSVGWNGRYSAEGWTATGDISFSRVDREDLILETYAGTGRGNLGATDNMGFTMTPRGAVFRPSLNYADPNLIRLTSPQGWGGDIDGPGGRILGGQDGYYNERSVRDELVALRASIERELGGPFRSVELGFNYTTRDKQLTPNEFFLGLRGNTDGTTSVPIPQNALLQPTNLAFLGLGPMVSYDPLTLLNSGIYNLVRNPNSDVSTKGWSVSEDVMTFWTMLNISADIGATQLTGNVGAQVVFTDQSSAGTASSGAPAVLAADVRGGDEYTKVLPSLNLSLRIPGGWVARLGAARQMARPRLDEMRASSNFGFNQQLAVTGGLPFSGSGGNPRLRPWVADAVDVSLEKYFGGEGYLALSLFYKDLKSYIYEQVQPYDFTGFPVPSGVTLQPFQFQGFLTVPANGDGGTMKGAELSGTLPFRVFTTWLDGFGLTGSVSYTDTNVSPQPDAPPEDLPGYSKWVGNLTAYFERAGFSIRGSARHRSSFIGELRGFGGGNERRRAAAETVIDAQVSYEFQQGSMLQGLTILGQVNNITDEPFVTFADDDRRRVIDHQSYGRRYLLGVSYRFR